VPRTLRFAGVGGARVPARLLEEADALGLHVFEGYGLTEAASVVSLNTPDARRTGSAGRPLRHVRIGRGEDGEILVGGSTLTAHLGDPEPRAADAPYATGDLGGLDEDGYLHVLGRKRELLVTSFGRNVSPGWVESELLGHPAVAQAAVVGEGLPSLVAVLVAHPGRAAGLAGAVQAANARLPDYARVGAFVVADEPFRRDNGLLTRGGTPDRAAIAVRHVAPRQPVPAAVPSTTGHGVPRTG
jgi:long-subunit acyl-CoA synthetase (AMP-forming)